MHVGLSIFFQNISGQQADRDVIRNELLLADQAEPLGFDSVWGVEHHFTNYTMIPDISQFLTWVAARTKRVQLGSMVTVVPWHDPIRVAESWAWLDHVSGGRAILGMGRGVGRVEFEGLQVNMGQSRQMFVEYAEAIANALETGYLEYDGEIYKQPRVGIRPFPALSFKGRTYASALSPESVKLMARLGFGILMIAQKPWPDMLSDISLYRETYRELNGVEAPKPILATFVACSESRTQADEMFEEYLINYSRSAVQHYEFDNAALAEISGYEYYAGLSRLIAKYGIDGVSRELSKLQVWGTPDDVTDKLIEYQRSGDFGGLLVVAAYGGMPFELGQANLELFAEKVLPRLKAEPPIGAIPRKFPPSAIGGARSPRDVSTEHLAS